ncbi:MAG: ABC transporter ATP-binding protein [Firmicutes bacterium]|nr:ABC transporter ATP-binding protein [Bacillota bacterium]
MNDIILTVDGLKTYFYIDKQVIKSVNGVSLKVRRGKTLGLVGESGCGKTVTSLSILQLLPKLARISGGSIVYHSLKGDIELRNLPRNGKKMRSIRGKEIAMIFQDPMTSLNPVYPIGYQIMENLLYHENISKVDARKKVIKLLSELGIPKPESRIDDYPHQFSGGMRQRVMIAMAMICNPSLLIADEPTTALDVTIQAQIIEIMKQVQREHGTSIMLITHNMGLIADMADDVAVMYMGKIVESGTIQDVLGNPQHPYTRALLKSVPVLGIGKRRRLEPIRGTTPDPLNMPEGCEFSTRCDYVTDQCSTEPPVLDIGSGHLVKCWQCKGRCLT